eukprot:gene8949-13853_t
MKGVRNVPVHVVVDVRYPEPVSNSPKAEPAEPPPAPCPASPQAPPPTPSNFTFHYKHFHCDEPVVPQAPEASPAFVSSLSCDLAFVTERYKEGAEAGDRVDKPQAGQNALPVASVLDCREGHSPSTSPGGSLMQLATPALELASLPVWKRLLRSRHRYAARVVSLLATTARATHVRAAVGHCTDSNCVAVSEVVVHLPCILSSDGVLVARNREERTIVIRHACDSIMQEMLEGEGGRPRERGPPPFCPLSPSPEESRRLLAHTKKWKILALQLMRSHRQLTSPADAHGTTGHRPQAVVDNEAAGAEPVVNRLLYIELMSILYNQLLPSVASVLARSLAMQDWSEDMRAVDFNVCETSESMGATVAAWSESVEEAQALLVDLKDRVSAASKGVIRTPTCPSPCAGRQEKKCAAVGRWNVHTLSDGAPDTSSWSPALPPRQSHRSGSGKRAARQAGRSLRNDCPRRHRPACPASKGHLLPCSCVHPIDPPSPSEILSLTGVSGHQCDLLQLSKGGGPSRRPGSSGILLVKGRPESSSHRRPPAGKKEGLLPSQAISVGGLSGVAWKPRTKLRRPATGLQRVPPKGPLGRAGVCSQGRPPREGLSKSRPSSAPPHEYASEAPSRGTEQLPVAAGCWGGSPDGGHTGTGAPADGAGSNKNRRLIHVVPSSQSGGSPTCNTFSSRSPIEDRGGEAIDATSSPVPPNHQLSSFSGHPPTVKDWDHDGTDATSSSKNANLASLSGPPSQQLACQSSSSLSSHSPVKDLDHPASLSVPPRQQLGFLTNSSFNSYSYMKDRDRELVDASSSSKRAGPAAPSVLSICTQPSADRHERAWASTQGNSNGSETGHTIPSTVGSADAAPQRTQSPLLACMDAKAARALLQTVVTTSARKVLWRHGGLAAAPLSKPQKLFNDDAHQFVYATASIRGQVPQLDVCETSAKFKLAPCVPSRQVKRAAALEGDRAADSHRAVRKKLSLAADRIRQVIDGFGTPDEPNPCDKWKACSLAPLQRLRGAETIFWSQ